MSNNLKLPTSYSANWGSGLNAYIDSLNNRLSSLEKNFLINSQNNTTVVQNLGCYSSGLVGNSTKIEYKDNIITVSDLNAYIGGDIMTFFNVPASRKEYTLNMTSYTSLNVAFYVFLQYNFVSTDFEIVIDVNSNSLNYTRILIGMFFQGKFAPIYYSNLKTIAQHLDEYTRATIELDTHNVPIIVEVGSNINPKITLGTLTKGTDSTGPILSLTGIGYTQGSGESKWYSDSDKLNTKMLTFSPTPTILYLEDYVDSDDETDIGEIRTRLVDDFSHYSTETEDSKEKYAGHYFRILLTPFNDLIVVQKSADSDYIAPVEYSHKEQNLRNRRFNNIFTRKWDEKDTFDDTAAGAYTDGTGKYEVALDALFCIEIGRFSHNTFPEGQVIHSNNPEEASHIYFDTMKSVFPHYNVKITYTQDTMQASSTATGLYGDSSTADQLIRSATVGEVCLINDSQTMWQCSQSYTGETLTIFNFYNYWTLLTNGNSSSALQHCFTFVMAQENGSCTQMRWNIWQQKLGRINMNTIKWSDGEGSTQTIWIKLNALRANSELLIDQKWMEDWALDKNNFLFDKQRVKTNIYLGSESGFGITNYTDTSTTDRYLSDFVGEEKKLGIVIENLASTSASSASYTFELINHNNSLMKMRSVGDLTLETDADFKVTGGTSVTMETVRGPVNISAQSGIHLTGQVSVSDTLTVTNNLIVTSGNINVNTGYISVTSDRRMKDNINIYNHNILDAICKVPIQTFTYRGSDIKQIGVMAQDLVEFFDDHDLVVTSENHPELSDKLSLKETKLIYLLWKGLQELYALIKTNNI